MKNQASITALMSAFGRAYHFENESAPVFSDSAAEKLLSREEYEQMKKYILSGIDFFAPEKKTDFSSEREALRYLINTHIAPTPLCRSTYCEKALKSAFSTGTEQYVILGAGLDTFAFRESEISKKHKIYAVDHPKTLEDTLFRIKRAELEIPQNLTFVAVDFSSDSLKEKLLSSGFDPSKKNFFSWLGVSYYLSKSEIEGMLKSLSGIMADGSTLLFDYADEGLFLSGEKRVQNMLAMAAAGGEEMKSSFDYKSMELMLSDFGFLIYEILTPRDIQEKIIKNSDMTAFEHINYIQAVFKQTL